MKDDVVLNKVASIKRCLKRISDIYSAHPDKFRTDYTAQDATILNLQRACDTCIDLANYIVKKNQLGIPQNSRDSFDLLLSAKIINDGQLILKMKRMVGFRNMSVHEYASLNVEIIESILKNNLVDFTDFAEHILSLPD